MVLANSRSHARPAWAWCGLTLALLAIATAVTSGLGYRLGWWPYATGFRVLGISAALGGAAALLSLVAALVNWGLHRLAAARAVIGFLLGLLVVGIPLQWKMAHDRLPSIHDISTDTQDPPPLVAAARLRRPGDHAIGYEGAALAIRQQAAYPDIRPLHTHADPQRALVAARSVVLGMGMQVVGESAAEGRIEAVDTTTLFGFRDDFVVRVRAGAPGARVDARSMSRVGRSDLGKNAARIKTFLRRLREELPD